MESAANDRQAQDVLSPAKPAPLSCADIAARLRRNPVSIFRVIKRLGLKPEIETGNGYKFYSEDSIPAIDAAMRAPNRKREIAL